MRVSIVSPNPSLRLGLRELLSGCEDIDIVSVAASVDDVDENMETDALVLASVSTASFSALDKFPAVLLLCDDADDARALQAARVKAWGAIPLDAEEDELAAALRGVTEGLWVLAPVFGSELMRGSFGRVVPSDESPIEPLTARELEILKALSRGLANKQIAASLGISEHTVKFHVSSVFAKLGVGGRTEAVSRGLSLGLISL